ncbi:MAG: hypothetical protein LBD78_04470 [Spirochaetaceae bacterium]|nr:hypothetical protein [Spirochaetaceae bacterium]
MLVLSCATTNPYTPIDDAVHLGDYENGLETIEDKKKSIYRDKDTILYYLDKGMLNHYARRYEESIQVLQDGEQAIEEAYTKSITMEISSYLVNDRVRDYDGEDYEDIYINAFNALNYYYIQKPEDALVEIRRMNNKLQFLASKYGVITSNLQKQALESSVQIPYDPESAETRFNNSALARYLGLLFYRGIGQYDDARIDRDQLKLAFANAPWVYSYPLPASLEGELDIPPGKGRLNILAFSGLSPVKVEESIRIPLPNKRWIKIALPVLEYRPSLVKWIEVTVNGGESFHLELLEDIEAVARETFKEKSGVIYLKSIIRGITKGVTSSVLSGASEEVGSDAGLALWLISLGTQAFAEASEQADLRISRYFPAKAWVGGLNLDPGVYALKVNYYAANGSLLASYTDDQVRVREDALNLVEAVCVR